LNTLSRQSLLTSEGAQTGVDSIRVVAAVIEREGRILITRRRAGAHLGGLWEFPGGKAEAAESLEQALRREIREELDLNISVEAPIDTVVWQYPDKLVSIVFFRCVTRGEPRPLEGQEMMWVAASDLGNYEFPPADAGLIARLTRR
jgi:8-oxo-dGTP diphosphatase